jgi:ketosteroid isomerase-like protein
MESHRIQNIVSLHIGCRRGAALRMTLLAIAFSVLCAVPARADDDRQRAVLAAHEKRRVATLNGDSDAVASMMTDDLTFTHANAVVETKAQFVDALKTRRLSYKALTNEDRQVRVHGGTGVVSGTCRILVDASGTEIDIRVRFTELWVKEGERWRMMLWHATQVQ